MAKDIEKFFKGQVSAWRTLVETKKEGKEKSDRTKNPPIAISRDLGTGGRFIAEKLACCLNYKLYDKEIIELIARERKIHKELIETLDERTRSNLELWFEGIIKGKMIQASEYITTLAKVIRSLAELGGVILLGRASNIILGEGGGLRLRIIAPLEYRIKNLVKYEHYSEDKARETIKKTDSERSQFLKTYFNSNIADPLNYDLVINRACFSSIDTIVKIITDMLSSITLKEIGSC